MPMALLVEAHGRERRERIPGCYGGAGYTDRFPHFFTWG